MSITLFAFSLDSDDDFSIVVSDHDSDGMGRQSTHSHQLCGWRIGSTQVISLKPMVMISHQFIISAEKMMVTLNSMDLSHHLAFQNLLKDLEMSTGLKALNKSSLKKMKVKMGS
ncbi:hypothetical protein Q3G72_027722 [Acer saccharum]|nr:hypothetical protein Q3G72_027722 [Acer saccharum]